MDRRADDRSYNEKPWHARYLCRGLTRDRECAGREADEARAVEQVAEDVAGVPDAKVIVDVAEDEQGEGLRDAAAQEARGDEGEGIGDHAKGAGLIRGKAVGG